MHKKLKQIVVTRIRSFSSTKDTKQYLDTLDKHWSLATPRAPKGNNIVVDYAKGSWIFGK